MPHNREPKDVTALLLDPNPDVQAEGYLEFLHKTYWAPGVTQDDILNLACRELHIKPRHVIGALKYLEPAMLWASQDGLQYDKLKMVEAAAEYNKLKKEALPPIIVWHMYDDPNMRYIVHDGHHRTYYAYRYNQKLSALVLEPIGAYEDVEKRLKYAYQIRKRVIDLPIIRMGHTE
jgi:hypothetical protein